MLPAVPIHSLRKWGGILYAWLALVCSAIAAPPANDLCSGAEVVPGAGPFPWFSSVTADVSDATTTGDPSAPSCASGSLSRSIWYRFTPSATALYTLSVSDDTATTVPDTVMGVYTSAGGCGGPFTAVACNDDAGGLPSALSATLNGATTYYIVIWVSQFSAPLTNGHGAVQLKVSRPTTPPNDGCAGAEIIPGSGPFPWLTSVVDTSFATTTGDPPPACQASFSRSIWYRFTPARTTTYTISTCGDTGTTVFDTLLAIYIAPSCGGPYTPLACNDNSCGARAALTTTLNAASTYYIVAWETGTDPYTPGETSIQLRVSGIFEPSVTTTPASSITSTSAVLNASVNPNGAATTAWFDWGPSTNFANSTPPQAIGAGSSNLSVSAGLSGLSAGTWFFRVRATNVIGPASGSNLSFAWNSSRPTITAPAISSGGAFGFQFAGQSHQKYLILASSNLSSWFLVATAADNGSGSFTFFDSAPATVSKRFYRVLTP